MVDHESLILFQDFIIWKPDAEPATRAKQRSPGFVAYDRMTWISGFGFHFPSAFLRPPEAEETKRMKVLAMVNNTI